MRMRPEHVILVLLFLLGLIAVDKAEATQYEEALADIHESLTTGDGAAAGASALSIELSQVGAWVPAQPPGLASLLQTIANTPPIPPAANTATYQLTAPNPTALAAAAAYQAYAANNLSPSASAAAASIAAVTAPSGPPTIVGDADAVARILELNGAQDQAIGALQAAKIGRTAALNQFQSDEQAVTQTLISWQDPSAATNKAISLYLSSYGLEDYPTSKTTANVSAFISGIIANPTELGALQEGVNPNDLLPCNQRDCPNDNSYFISRITPALNTTIRDASTIAWYEEAVLATVSPGTAATTIRQDIVQVLGADPNTTVPPLVAQLISALSGINPNSMTPDIAATATAAYNSLSKYQPPGQ